MVYHAFDFNNKIIDLVVLVFLLNAGKLAFMAV